jgi:nitrogen fixation protein FixH
MGLASTAGESGPRPLTGRVVLAWVIAFFAVVALVNAVMIRAALTTFGGVETASAYQAGQVFEREAAAARAQDARQWRVQANLRRDGGDAVLEIKAHDAEGRALTGLSATAGLHHPTDARGDHAVPLAEAAPGRFSGAVAAAPGQWDVLIEFSRAGERVFRSRNRVVLK